MATPKKNKNEELSCLIASVMAGEISDEQYDKLINLLRADEKNLEYYIEFSTTWALLDEKYNNSSLEDTGEFGPAVVKALLENEESAPEVIIEKENIEVIDKPEKKSPSRSLKENKFFRIFDKLVYLAAVCMIVFIVYSHVSPPKMHVPIATLRHQLNAEWDNVSGKFTNGSILYTGPMSLKKGLAEIVLNNGAEVILEGPCEFKLEDDYQIYLKQGAIVANIEQVFDKRLVVRTDNATVVDYGTEFGVSVDPDGNTTTMVYKGSVELRQGSDPFKYDKAMRLVKDQGGQVNIKGSINPIKPDSVNFIRKDEFDTKVMAANGSAYHRWKDYSYQLSNRKDLIAYYTFDRNNDNILINHSAATRDSYTGSLESSAEPEVCPKWVQGRWSQKTALSFVRSSKQYVKIVSDDNLYINDKITLAAWIRIDKSNGGGHIISSRLAEGSINYQLGYNISENPIESSKIQFARYSDNPIRNYSPNIPEQKLTGWHLLVASHDNSQVKFYLDGKLLGIEKYEYSGSPVVTDLLIGSDRSGNKMFNGVIGEVAIFNSILDDVEIENMYYQGRP